jgi:hypothetical protein
MGGRAANIAPRPLPAAPIFQLQPRPFSRAENWPETMTIIPSRPKLDANAAFALMLESACEDFENLMDLIDGDIKVMTRPRDPAMSSHKAHRLLRAPARIPMALAKSFLFFANRANRICWKNKALLTVHRSERERFLKATAPLTSLRDVNEHGFDGDTRSSKRMPMLHLQESGGMGDETSLVIAGRDQILMGPLNLHTIYLAVERMRGLAGFATLQRMNQSPP